MYRPGTQSGKWVGSSTAARRLGDQLLSLARQACGLRRGLLA